MAPKLIIQNPHLFRCFGRGKKLCACPPRLKPVCRATRLTDRRSPIVLRAVPGERPKGYVAIDKRVTGLWGYEPEPSDGAKLTYITLVARAEKRSRWVYARPETLAQERGITSRVLAEHLKELVGLGMILRVPMCDVIEARRGIRYLTVFLLDLPMNFGGVADESAAENAATGPTAEDERYAKSSFSLAHPDGAEEPGDEANELAEGVEGEDLP